VSRIGPALFRARTIGTEGSNPSRSANESLRTDTRYWPLTVSEQDIIEHRADLFDAVSYLMLSSSQIVMTGVVNDAERLAGIFTERDVLMRVVGRPIDLGQTAVRNYMTRDPVTLPSDSSVAFALNRMLIEGFRHIPLVNERGCPTGVVSMRRLIEYLSDLFNRDILNLPPEPRASFRSREGA
jgi:CBS domain-containing protein